MKPCFITKLHQEQRPLVACAKKAEHHPSTKKSLFISPLEARWAAECKHVWQLGDCEHRRWVQQKHIIFISGFGNELSRIQDAFYRAHFEVVEKEYGSTATYFGPQSINAPEMNIGSIYRRILVEYNKLNKPIILVGHSKGGLEILYTILHHPELIQDGIVDGIVLLQTPINGVYLLDKKSNNAFIQRIISLCGDGVQALTQEAAAEKLERYLARLTIITHNTHGLIAAQDLLEEISSKIFYVRSYQHKRTLNPKLSFLNFFLRHEPEQQNDGVILLDSQKSNAIGRELGIIRADHLEFTEPHPEKSRRYHRTKAFIRALLQEVHKNLEP